MGSGCALFLCVNHVGSTQFISMKNDNKEKTMPPWCNGCDKPQRHCCCKKDCEQGLKIEQERVYGEERKVTVYSADGKHKTILRFEDGKLAGYITYESKSTWTLRSSGSA